MIITADELERVTETDTETAGERLRPEPKRYARTNCQRRDFCMLRICLIFCSSRITPIVEQASQFAAVFNIAEAAAAAAASSE